MFLTNREFAQLNITAQSAWDALVMVEDTVCAGLDSILVALTSPKAIRIYSVSWEAIKITAILAGGLAFYTGVLARYGWEWLMVQCDRYVESCLKAEEAAVEASTPEPATEDNWLEGAPEALPAVQEWPEEVEEVAPLENLPMVEDAPIEEVALPEVIEDVKPKSRARKGKGGTATPRTRKVKVEEVAEGAIA